MRLKQCKNTQIKALGITNRIDDADRWKSQAAPRIGLYSDFSIFCSISDRVRYVTHPIIEQITPEMVPKHCNSPVSIGWRHKARKSSRRGHQTTEAMTSKEYHNRSITRHNQHPHRTEDSITKEGGERCTIGISTITVRYSNIPSQRQHNHCSIRKKQGCSY